MSFEDVANIVDTPAGRAVRNAGLGAMARLTDRTVLTILRFLPDHALLTVARCSRALFFFADDDLLIWKRRCLNRTKGDFEWKGTWKRTALLARHRPAGRTVLRIALRGFYSPLLCEQWRRQFSPLAPLSTLPAKHVPIERRRCPSVAEFVELYDKPCRPVILTGILDEWPAFRDQEWSLPRLEARFANHWFKTDEVVDGKKIKMRFGNYLSYYRNNHDEDPIYLFDPDFLERAPELARDYRVPPYFTEDLFAVLGEKRRPLYRWWVIGPARSGSCFHLDPYMTSAWNALLSGRKRWLLYPPGHVPPGVEEEVDSDGEKSYDAPEPMEYMLDEFPRIPSDQRPIECIQEAGETIFVPSGWWHMVLNITDTVAVTQNVMNSANFGTVWADVRKDNKKMKKRLKKKLKKKRPEVYARFLSRRRPASN